MNIRTAIHALDEHRTMLMEPLEPRTLLSVTGLLKYHVDNASTGQTLNESILTAANVNISTFGKKFSTTVDGQVYAQPLYVSKIKMTAGAQLGVHNVAYVATEHDSLYAIDADSGAVLWQDSFIDPAAQVTTVPSGETGTDDLTPEIGITSTPVIDGATSTLYVVAKTKEMRGGWAHYVQRLHAIDLASGREKTTPAVIADTIWDGSNYFYVSGPSVNGAGDGNVNGIVTYNAVRQHQRAALTLVKGTVYIASASHGDNGPYHGWILGYSAAKLKLTAAFNTTPSGTEGGIWESGAGVTSDASGNLYVVTGNGTFDTTFTSAGLPSHGDFGNAVLKLAVDTRTNSGRQNVNGWGLKVLSYFVPNDFNTRNDQDLDLGSGGPLILPDSAGSKAHRHLLLTGGKDGRMFLLDRDRLGGYDPAGDHAVQVIDNGSGIYSTPAYWGGIVYVAGTGDNAKTYSVINAAMSVSPTSISPDAYGFPGSTPAISSYRGANGIAWDIDHGSAQLRAYSAYGYGLQLFTSDLAGGRDALGSAIKFSVPTIVDGKVYVGTLDALVGYGLL